MYYALTDLCRPRLIVSSKVFQVVFVHSVCNWALFLPSCCYPFMLHVVANSIWIFLVSRQLVRRHFLSQISVNGMALSTYSEKTISLTKSFFHYDNITFLLTQWSRVLLEKLTGPQLVKKFPAFDETRRFITPFTTPPNSLSWARSIQSMPSHLISWTPILILSPHLRVDLPNSPPKTLYAPLLSSVRATWPIHLILLDLIIILLRLLCLTGHGRFRDWMRGTVVRVRRLERGLVLAFLCRWWWWWWRWSDRHSTGQENRHFTAPEGALLCWQR